jgi:hypothetical protein
MNDSLLVIDGVQVFRTGLELPDGLPEPAWEEIGKTLGSIETAYQWMVGDWWIFGEQHYGNRRDIVEHSSWPGPGFNTCHTCGTVSRAFKSDLRRSLLTFRHHKEIASLKRVSPKLANEILVWCEQPLLEGKKKPRSIRAMQKEIKRRLNPHVALTENKEKAHKNPYLDLYVQFMAPISQLSEKNWDIDNIASVQVEIFKDLLSDDLAACNKALTLIKSFIKKVEALPCATDQVKN